MALFTQKSYTFVPYLELIAGLIIKARLWALVLLGYDLDVIVKPIPEKKS